MIIIPATVQFRKQKLEHDVIIDTGFSGGLYIDKRHLKTLRAEFLPVAQENEPETATGEKVRGHMTKLIVRLDEAEVEAMVDTFCPVGGTQTTLLGVEFLCAVQAIVGIGAMEYVFRKPNARRSSYNWKVEPRDLSDWIIPTRRPMTKWW